VGSRIGLAGGFMDPIPCSIERLQIPRFQVPRLRTQLVEGAGFHKKRDLQGTVVPPKADNVPLRIVAPASPFAGGAFSLLQQVRLPGDHLNLLSEAVTLAILVGQGMFETG